MNSELMTILSNETNSFISEIKRNLDETGTTSSGKTKNSLRFEIVEQGYKIIITVFGKEYFAVVETGRRPTPGVKPSYSMVKSIKEWIDVEGLPYSAWGVAVNINEHGTKLWQQGGRTDIFTDPKESFADRIFSEAVENIASEYFRKATVSFE